MYDMSLWHLFWMVPAATVIGMGGSLAYSVYWLSVVMESPNTLENFIIREQDMGYRFWLLALGAVLVLLVISSDQISGLAYVAFVYWLPMLAVYIGYTFVIYLLPDRRILAILASPFLAVATLGLINWFTGRYYFDPLVAGLCIGAFVSLGETVKDVLKKFYFYGETEDWPPWDQTAYVWGGWIGLMLLFKFQYGLSMKLTYVTLLVAMLLYAVIHSTVTLGFRYVLFGPPKKL